MQIDFKKYKLDVLAVLIFALISLLYCYPQLSGKKLNQHDNISWQGMSREAMAYYDSTGKDVMWSNSMFGGMPTYATYVGSTSTNYIGYIQSVFQAIGKPAYFFFIAMVCFYILMRVLKINKWLGMAGALAYAFASYNAIIISAGHDTKMLVMGYMPVVLAGAFMIYGSRKLTGAALLGVAFSLIFTNNHFQVIFYILIMLLCFGIGMLFVAIKEGIIKNFLISSVIAVVIAAIGVGPCMTSVVTIKEYSKATMRGGASELSGHDVKTNGGLDKEYAFRWSNGIGETFCLMIPYLYGGSSMESASKAPKTSELVGGNTDQLPLYWGPQPFLGGPVYFGAVVCFLFVLGLIVVKNNHKWWILAASVICIVMSWGKNFEAINYFLFDHIPLLNNFRTPSMILVIPQFLFPLLGIMAVQEFLKPDTNKDKLWKDLKIAAGITAGLCILLGVGGSIFFGFTGPEDARYQPELLKALREDRASLAAMSGLKSALFILVATGLLWAFLKNKIKAEMMILGIGILFLVDLLPVAHEYLNDKNFQDPAEYESVFEPREVDKMILKDPDPYYRVLDLSRDTYNDAVQAYFHKCVGGYHPAKMEIYQDLIDRHLGRKGYNEQVLDMLNTKYIIVGGQKGAPRAIPNPNANGNAWFVEEVKWVNTADEEIEGMNAANIGDTAIVPNAFNSKKTAIIRNTFKSDIGSYTFGKDSTSFVKLAKYGLNDISFVSHNSKNGLAVFSDIYYAKGWKAFVDGQETPIVKANYVLRCIKIPAGDHKIAFSFKPESYYTSKKIALVSSLILIGICIAAFFPVFKKKTTPGVSDGNE